MPRASVERARDLLAADARLEVVHFDTFAGEPFLSVRLAADDKRTLLSVLRDELGLSGPKFGCGEGECGACMVLVDGQPQTACNLPLWAVQGQAVVTLEGLGTPEHPHSLQTACIDERAAQCGYCSNGFVMATVALLERCPQPTDEQVREALSHNLCRCGTHVEILQAVHLAADYSAADYSAADTAAAGGPTG